MQLASDFGHSSTDKAGLSWKKVISHMVRSGLCKVTAIMRIRWVQSFSKIHEMMILFIHKKYI